MITTHQNGAFTIVSFIYEHETMRFCHVAYMFTGKVPMKLTSITYITFFMVRTILAVIGFQVIVR